MYSYYIGLLYNLLADAELGLKLVPQHVYDIQSAFYPTVELTYGVPLDTRHTYTKSVFSNPCPIFITRPFSNSSLPADWQMFCAAVASQSTQQLFINDISKWVNQTPTNRPMTDLYDAITGE